MHPQPDMPIRDVHDSDTLQRLFKQWRDLPAIALDTEFVRERTYHPVPGLIQVSDGTACWLVDPLPRRDLEPLLALLASESPVKVMHSAGQDLELLRLLGADAMRGLFDTQVAATLAGVADSPGYANLVESLLGVALDKGETRSDWTWRPLSDSQRHYAALDVAHLLPLYEKLSERLAQQGRQAWAAEECERLLADAWDPDPVTALRRQRQAWRLTPREQELLFRFWHWRERQARELDRPRGRVLDDSALNAFVRQPPRSREDLVAAGTPPGWIRRFGESFLETVADALQTPAERLETRFPPPPLSAPEKARLKALQAAIQDLAAHMGIPAGFLATRQTLDRLATGAQPPDAVPGTLRGWREQVVWPVLEKALAESS